MLWSTLWNKLGKQPLRITQHNHVTAIIEGKTYELDLKFDTKDRPYLVPREPKPAKPYDKIYHYTVSRERSDVLGSGSQVDWEYQVRTEAQAFEYLKAHFGNTLTRLVRTVGSKKSPAKLRTQHYDFIDKCWRDDRGEKLEY